MKSWRLALGLLIVFGLDHRAWAGGYDTPMLYSARHMGMGGAAVAYVDDPSALFHNPAGLAGIKRLSLLGDFSLLLGGITSAPEDGVSGVDSDLLVAPFFLVGAGYRLLDGLTIGAAVYPVASANATYQYANAERRPVTNSTKLVFIETTIGAGINIDAIRLNLGAGYRLTFVNLARDQVVDGKDQLGFDMSGWNVASFRVGAQEAIPKHLKLGFSYRHKTVTEVKQDSLTVWPILGGTATDGSAEFILPGRLIFGLRGDYKNFGAALDLEYALSSQNKDTTIRAKLTNGTEAALLNIFEWDNAITLRLGGEYRFALSKTRTLIPRLGFVYDARTSTKQYPTAFGTPPAPTFVLTAGAGYETGPYRVNVAYGYRFGSTTVAKEDLESNCVSCSKAGDYAIFLNGIYLDVSYDFH